MQASPFSEFEHILIQDGSSQAVYNALKEAFPGRFSTVSPAAVELHTTMELLTNNLVRVQLTEDTRSKRDCLPPLPTSMACILMLMDAGYFELKLFAAIHDREGSFICKHRRVLTRQYSARYGRMARISIATKGKN
ncbi:MULTISPECIES: hypothetical protein [unclassified Endozoicomonas]|uniref:hypothetical protein n=1 Tax=unclassified Endozoicomonas TaxID=2644528 RepID=UPI003BB49B52